MVFELLAQAAPPATGGGILETAVHQVPSLVVLCFIVRAFLLRLKEMETAATAREARVDDAFKEMLETIRDNGKHIAASTEVMRKAIELQPASHHELPTPRAVGIGVVP